MYSAVTVQIGKTERHVMPMSRDIFLAVTTVDIHADVVQWIWSAKPSHKFTNTTKRYRQSRDVVPGKIRMTCKFLPAQLT